MTAIRIEGVRKVFREGGREVVALDGIDLEIAQGEFVCLLGPSGCGKSTLLNAIAGFSPPTEGRVVANGLTVTEPGPERAMVFQEYALFPWMTVERNVAFGLELKLRATPLRADVRERRRSVKERVLALDPPMLLMDEPFGALDALTRRTLQDELLRIWAELRKTIVFVTHGIEESIYLADRVVVMTYRPGTVKRIVPVALPRPRDPASAEFNALKRDVGLLVMEEQARHAEAEALHGTGD